jgi:hypothetical protein
MPLRRRLFPAAAFHKKTIEDTLYPNFIHLNFSIEVGVGHKPVFQGFGEG